MKMRKFILWAVALTLLTLSAAWARRHKKHHRKQHRTEWIFRQSQGNDFPSYNSNKKSKRKKNKQSYSYSRQSLYNAVNATPARGHYTASSLLKVGIPRGMSNRVIDHTAMVVYFNTQYHIPNCVIYDFSSTEALQCDAPGAERRKNYKYNPDPATAASPDRGDYRGSGYDRGHMAPAMDMKWSKASMTEAFYMTNMCPQNHQLNNNVWRIMEETIHRWAKRDKRLIIATGPVPGNDMEMIGPRRNIAVPKAFYKVVYAPGQGRAIAFVYNNATDNGQGSMRSHVVSIDYVERVTGLDFFPTLSPQVQTSLESRSNYDLWQ